MTRDKIIERLDIQESIEGKTENIKLLRCFLACIKTAQQWSPFVNVKHHRYGKLSYEIHMFYYCTDELEEYTKHILGLDK